MASYFANIAETALLWLYICITILCYMYKRPQGADWVRHLVLGIRYILQNLIDTMTQLVFPAYEESEVATDNPRPSDIPDVSSSKAIVWDQSSCPTNLVLCANDPEEVKLSVIDVSNPSRENISENKIPDLKKLSNGDSVYITSVIDVHNIYVRKVMDKSDDFMNFIEEVNSYCVAGRPIGKFPRPNNIIGARSRKVGLYCRAKVLKKYTDSSYYVQFIDFGHKEYVNLSVIVTLTAQLIEIPTTVSLVKLKNIPLCTLNDDAFAYVNSIIDLEIITIENIEEDTNDVILKTSKNQNINNHLSMLIFASNETQSVQI